MTPADALALLRTQPEPVRRAVECLLLSIDPQAVASFGARYTTGAVADAVMGREPDLGPLDGAVVEISVTD